MKKRKAKWGLPGNSTQGCISLNPIKSYDCFKLQGNLLIKAFIHSTTTVLDSKVLGNKVNLTTTWHDFSFCSAVEKKLKTCRSTGKNTPEVTHGYRLRSFEGFSWEGIRKFLLTVSISSVKYGGPCGVVHLKCKMKKNNKIKCKMMPLRLS